MGTSGLSRFNDLPATAAEEGLLDNVNKVFVAADRSYRLIDGAVLRDDAPPPGLAWW